VGYVMDTPRAECLQRNRGREGRARVPDVAVHVAAKRMELPKREEGFDELYTVRAAGGAFEVAPRP
jgi:predicted kinase